MVFIVDVSLDVEGAGLSVIEAAGAEHDNTHTWQVFAGYRFKSWLAAEVACSNLGKTDGDFTAILDGPETVSGELESSYQALAGSALFSWPVAPWIAPFARLGGHYWQHDMALSGDGISANETDSGLNLLYGVGVDLFVASFLGIRVDWLRYQGIENEPGIDVREIGLFVRF